VELVEEGPGRKEGRKEGVGRRGWRLGTSVVCRSKILHDAGRPQLLPFRPAATAAPRDNAHRVRIALLGRIARKTPECGLLLPL